MIWMPIGRPPFAGAIGAAMTGSPMHESGCVSNPSVHLTRRRDNTERSNLCLGEWRERKFSKSDAV